MDGYLSPLFPIGYLLYSLSDSLAFLVAILLTNKIFPQKRLKIPLLFVFFLILDLASKWTGLSYFFGGLALHDKSASFYTILIAGLFVYIRIRIIKLDMSNAFKFTGLFILLFVISSVIIKFFSVSRFFFD